MDTHGLPNKAKATENVVNFKSKNWMNKSRNKQGQRRSAYTDLKVTTGIPSFFEQTERFFTQTEHLSNGALIEEFD